MIKTEVYGEYVEHRVVEKEQDKGSLKKTRHLTRRSSEIIFIIAMLFFPVLQFIIFWIVPNFNSLILGFQTPTDGSFTLLNFKQFFKYMFEGKNISGRYNEIVYAFKNSLIFAAVSIFICTPLVIFFSYVLFRKVPMSGVFKVVFYLPSFFSLARLSLISCISLAVMIVTPFSCAQLTQPVKTSFKKGRGTLTIIWSASSVKVTDWSSKRSTA